MTHASLCKKTYKKDPWLQRSPFPVLFSLVALLFASGNFLFGTAPPPTPITITTTSLPNATIGQPYLNASGNTVQLKAKGGSGTFGWCYTVGGQMDCPLPAPSASASVSLLYEGLSFNSDGTITGTPTSMSPISFSVYAENPVTQKNLSPTSQFTITIGACTSATIAPDSSTPLPTGEQGVAYPGVQFTASGCQGPYTFSAIALNPFAQNSFPTGLTLNSATGAFLGTPTLAGTFNIVIAATDAFQGVTKVEYSLTILPPPSITTTSPLPDGVVGVAYSQQITATGGTPPYIVFHERSAARNCQYRPQRGSHLRDTNQGGNLQLQRRRHRQSGSASGIAVPGHFRYRCFPNSGQPAESDVQCEPQRQCSAYASHYVGADRKRNAAGELYGDR